MSLDFTKYGFTEYNPEWLATAQQQRVQVDLTIFLEKGQTLEGLRDYIDRQLNSYADFACRVDSVAPHDKTICTEADYDEMVAEL